MQSHASTCGLLHRRPLQLPTKAFGNRHHLPQAARVVHCDRKQRSCALRTCATAEVQVAEDVKQPSAESQTPAPSPATGLAKGEDWAAAVEALSQGKIHKLQITTTNKGGARGQIEGLTGIEAFLPYSKLCTGIAGGQQRKDFSGLHGTVINVKVVAVDVEARNCIVSERATLQDKAINQYKRGDVVDVSIRNLVPYGAFGTIVDPETKQIIGGHGLLHISDMSYDHVAVPEDKVNVGDVVRCKIKEVNKAKQRIGFSLKLMEDDPLTETLDQLLPANLRDSVVQVPVNIPQGVKDICAELQKEEGIQSVFLGRQVEERRVVSQDLELWISKEVMEDGFTLVTRAGRTVQELKVTTAVPLEEMKSAIQRVLQRLT